jgi:leader peptidase (prepilin peptidase)/N-methyltransferase
VVGLLVGSFLNVVIYRLPIMLERQWREDCENARGSGGCAAASAEPAFNLVVPRSACPACRAPISAWQNIPGRELPPPARPLRRLPRIDQPALPARRSA